MNTAIIKQTTKRPSDEEQKDSLNRLIAGDLSHDEQIRHIMNLSIGHLSVDVIAYAVTLFRAHMKALSLPLAGDDLVDLCGTGGDKSGSFNISTTAAFVVAGAGVPVAKHGNVSITSKSGSIDVLRALGVAIPEDEAHARAQFEKAGICFLFAPHFHPSFARFAAARKELAAKGERTIFNILGPLLNPAGVQRAVLGVFREDFVAPLAAVMAQTGTEKALVFCGAGLDELSLAGRNVIAEIKDGALIASSPYEKSAADFGLAPCTLDDLRGGDPADNAALTLDILSGALPGPKTDMVILNAGAALYAAQDGLSMDEALARARHALQSGAALRVLEACRDEHS